MKKRVIRKETQKRESGKARNASRKRLRARIEIDVNIYNKKKKQWATNNNWEIGLNTQFLGAMRKSSVCVFFSAAHFI